MGWIKRNLILVIASVVALGLVGGGGFYIYLDWTRNKEASTKLTKIYGDLKELQQRKPSPGNKTVDNTKIAKEQQQQVQAWIASARNYFKPIPSIPSGTVSSEAFKNALDHTVDSLQHAADNSGVTLPPKYDFSFSAQRPRVIFAANSLEPLAEQLGEVKTIAEMLFATRINSLDSIQRVRVCDDDQAGPQGDYIDQATVTNELAILKPYVITFHCFTPELARVVSAFASSSNALLIKSINIQPTPVSAGIGGAVDTTAVVPNPYQLAGRMRGEIPGAQPAPTGKGGLPTVLKEQLLRVTVELKLVKMLPKS